MWGRLLTTITKLNPTKSKIKTNKQKTFFLLNTSPNFCLVGCNKTKKSETRKKQSYNTTVSRNSGESRRGERLRKGAKLEEDAVTFV